MDFSTSSIDTGVKATDINIDGSTASTITCWAYAEAFDNGGVYEIGNTGTNAQDFCLRTLSGGSAVLKQGAFLDAGFADVTDNPITGTGITEQGSNDTNRVLVVFTMCEQRPVVTNSATSWGGQAMTLIIANDSIVGAGGRDGNLRAWILDEAGIQAASGNTLSTTWSGTTDVRREAVGQFFINVDQSTPTANTKVAETQVPLVTYTNTNLPDTNDMHIMSSQSNNSIAYVSSSLTGLVNGDLDTILLNSQSCALTVGSSDGADQVMTMTAEATADRNGGVSFSLLASSTSSNTWRMNHWGTADYDFTITGSLNNWVFFATTYNTTTSETFAAVLDVDDTVTSRGSEAVTLNIQDNIPLKIGQFSNDNITDPSSTIFNGRISDLRIYNRVLSLAELQSIFMAQGKDGIVNNLQVRYPLRDGTIGSNPPFFHKDSTVATNLVSQIGTWQSGLTGNGTIPTGTNRLLVAFAAHNDSTNGITATAFDYGDQAMTKHIQVEASETTNNYMSMWSLGEADIANATNSDFDITWSGTADRPIFMHCMYENVDQVTPMSNFQSNTNLTTTTITTTAITANANAVVIGNCSCGSSTGSYSTGNGFTIQLETDNSSHECAAIDQLSMGAALTPTWTYAGTPNRMAAVAGSINLDPNGVTIRTPSSVSDGDIMILCATAFGNSSGTAANMTTPSGWNAVTNLDLPTTISTPSMWVYRRTASSEPSTYTISSNQDCVHSAVISIYNNIDAAEDSTTTNTGTGTVMTSNSVATTNPVMVGRYFACDDGENEVISNIDDGVYLRQNISTMANDGTIGNGGSMLYADQLMNVTATGTKDATISDTEQWGTITFTFELDNTSSIIDVSGNKYNALASDDSIVRIEDALR